MRSRARGAAEAGADLPLSLLSTEPIAAPLAQTTAKSSVPAAGLFCCPAVEEGSPGPAAIAASQRAQLEQPSSSSAAAPNLRLGQTSARPRLELAFACCLSGDVQAEAAAARCALRQPVLLGGLKPETSTAELETWAGTEPSGLSYIYHTSSLPILASSRECGSGRALCEPEPICKVMSALHCCNHNRQQRRSMTERLLRQG